jgi:hypothetical protein
VLVHIQRVPLENVRLSNSLKGVYAEVIQMPTAKPRFERVASRGGIEILH